MSNQSTVEDEKTSTSQAEGWCIRMLQKSAIMLTSAILMVIYLVNLDQPFDHDTAVFTIAILFIASALTIMFVVWVARMIAVSIRMDRDIS
jgi:hypothetical protein